MPIPKKILINREEDYHTHYLGKYTDGHLFFGYETFVFSPNSNLSQNWQEYRREYAVLYLFDQEGHFIEADHWYAGTASENKDTNSKLEEMVSSRGPYEFCNIAVEPFQIEIDGEVFGLVADEEYETVELMPSSTISFAEPWDGWYST